MTGSVQSKSGLWRLFASDLSACREYVSAAPVFVAAEAVCQLLLPPVVGEMMNLGMRGVALRRIGLLGLRMVLLSLAAMACGVLATWTSTRAGQRFGAALRARLFDAALGCSCADMDMTGPASMLTRLTGDVNVLVMLLTLAMRVLLRAVIVLPAAFFLCLRLNVGLSAVILGSSVLMTVAVVWILLRGISGFTLLQRQTDRLNATLVEYLSAIRTVKAFGRDDAAGDAFQSAIDRLAETGARVGLRLAATMPAGTVFLNLATAAVLYLGGRMVMAGSFDLGGLQTCLSYIMQIISCVMMLAFSFFQISHGITCARRAREVLALSAEAENGQELPLSGAAALRFDHVGFQYRQGSGDRVLDDLSFTLEPGSVVAVTGGTGTGKTTLASLIARLYTADVGTIFLDGVPLQRISAASLRRRVSLAPQNSELFTGTIRSNLLLGNPGADDAALMDALEEARAAEWVRSLPDGLDTLLAQGGGNLSGGQRQRICLARALLRDGGLLILDDATSAIDLCTEAEVLAALRKRAGRQTVLIISQRVSAARAADRILVLEDGKLCASGTHGELLSASPVYRELVQSQQEGEVP